MTPKDNILFKQRDLYMFTLNLNIMKRFIAKTCFFTGTFDSKMLSINIVHKGNADKHICI